jgi:hypothetical protein
MVMKRCPTCGERYDDSELNYCTFDGARLESADRSQPGDPESGSERPVRNPWKAAFFALLALVVAGVGGVFSYPLLKPEQKKLTSAPPPPPFATSGGSAGSGSDTAMPEEIPAKVNVPQLSRTELLNLIPKHLLRRFRPGESGEPRPDEMRVLTSDKGNFVVMIGMGRASAGKVPLDQVLILKYENDEFQDITRAAMPGAYGPGALAPNVHVKFDINGSTLFLRRPASSRKVIDECAGCEHAYQQVTLEWDGSSYKEKRREWDNDRYTAFYVAAEALEKRRIDALARPLIDHPLDSAVEEGFERAAGRGWAVANLTDDADATIADYELKNGVERLVIRVAKVEGQWKATRIIAR